MGSTWFEILEAARRLAPRAGDGFTAVALAGEGKLRDTARALGTQVAAAWIGKFVKWGYAARLGELANPGRKPQAVYTLTDYGLSIAPKASHKDRLRRLLDAVEGVQKLRGNPWESRAWQDLLQAWKEISRSLKDEEKAREKGSRQA